MCGRFVTEVVSTPSRRVVLQGLAGTALAMLPAAGWGEAEYPSRAITVICPFAPGGINDVCARVVAKGLGAAFKQTVVTEIARAPARWSPWIIWRGPPRTVTCC